MDTGICPFLSSIQNKLAVSNQIQIISLDSQTAVFLSDYATLVRECNDIKQRDQN